MQRVEVGSLAELEVPRDFEKPSDSQLNISTLLRNIQRNFFLLWR